MTKKPKKEKIDPNELKIRELTDTLQRLQAEFENYKKRVDREKQEFVKYAAGTMALKLLPLLDSFEFALKGTEDKEKFTKGVEMIFAQFYSILENEGLRPIEAIGKKFDPYKHEVLMKDFSDKDEDIVIEEMQKGYMLNDKVIRHSKVKISKGKDDNKRNSAKECTGARKELPKEK
jgi:molecular chaperone GrpE